MMLFAAACSSSSNTGGTADGGAPTGDAATCGRLPATGASQVIPSSTAPDTETGMRVAFALDKQGRPVIAYATQVQDAVTLYVDTWDDCAGAWRAPIKVDDDVFVTGTRSYSLAVDTSDGRIAVAYEKKIHVVSPPRANDTRAAFVAISKDSGLTFTPAKVSDHAAEHGTETEGDINDVTQTRVALGGGRTFLAYNQTYQACPNGVDAAGQGCTAGTVLAADNGAAWTYDLVKDAANTVTNGKAETRALGLGLALDSANVPAVVAYLEPATGYNTTLLYYRPGYTDSAHITDSAGKQNDDDEAALTFDGVKARVVYGLQRGPIGAVTDYDLSVSSSDDGKTWAAQIPLPRPEHITYSHNIVASGGKVWVFAGGPHVFTSPDGATYQVEDDGLAQTSGSVTGAVDASGKYWFALQGVTPASGTHDGVVLYRQP